MSGSLGKVELCRAVDDPIHRQVLDCVLKTGECRVDRAISIDDMLNEAFMLAYFIHGKKETAVRIVLGAMSKLQVATTAQSKRLYYKPAGRSLLRRSNALRSKVTFSELHLLQRLIYIESEPYEKQREQSSSGAEIGKEDLLIHFIKHLVRVTLKRNSFYVTLGLSRLLYNYTTAETMGIYNLLVQDPERVKDDYYYRSRKGLLMQEIKERFGDIVKICHGQRGEDRFQAEPEPGRFAELVNDCLSSFTPWATPCLVPSGLDPILDTIPSLQFESREKEDQIEVNRIHAALHPNCFQRLIKALGLPLPDERLEVPHFFLSKENGDRNPDRRDRRPNLKLGEEDLSIIKENLSELAERRRKAATGLLRILVDGVDSSGLDLKREGRIRLELNRDPELIEVWTRDKTGDLLLASHLINYQQSASADPCQASIFLDGGQKISFAVSSSSDDSGSVIEIGYEESLHKRALSVLGRSRAAFAKFPLTSRGRTGSNILIPALSFLFLIIVTGVVVRYIQRRAQAPPTIQVADNQGSQSSAAPQGGLMDSRATDGNALPRAEKSPVPVRKESAAKEAQPAQTLTQKGADLPGRSTPSLPAQPPTVSVDPPAATLRVSPQPEITRGSTPREAAISLLEVKRVYVESEQGSSSEILRQMLVSQLQRSERFTLSKTRDEADALFKVSTRQIRSNPPKNGEILSFVVLVNARGEVIWPVKGGVSRGKYSGLTPEQVSAQVLKDLVEDIEQLRR
jgi:hypothetical protein